MFGGTVRFKSVFLAITFGGVSLGAAACGSQSDEATTASEAAPVVSSATVTTETIASTEPAPVAETEQDPAPETEVNATQSPTKISSVYDLEGPLCRPATDQLVNTIAPAWSDGMERQLILEIGQSSYLTGLAGFTQTTAVLTVESDSSDGWSFDWQNEETVYNLTIDGEPAGPEVYEGLDQFEGIRVLYSLDRDHSWGGVQNTDDLRELMRSFGSFADELSPDAGAIADDISSALDDEELADILSQDQQLYHSFERHDPTSEQNPVGDTLLLNPFGGSFIPATQRFVPRPDLNDGDCVAFELVTEVDGEVAGPMLAKALAEIDPAQAADWTEAELAALARNMGRNYETIAQFDVSTGFFRRISYWTQSHDRNQTRRKTIVDVTPDGR